MRYKSREIELFLCSKFVPAQSSTAIIICSHSCYFIRYPRSGCDPKMCEVSGGDRVHAVGLGLTLVLRLTYADLMGMPYDSSTPVC